MAVGLLLLLLLFYHCHNQVRGHSIGSSHPGVEAYLGCVGDVRGGLCQPHAFHSIARRRALLLKMVPKLKKRTCFRALRPTPPRCPATLGT